MKISLVNMSKHSIQILMNRIKPSVCQLRNLLGEIMSVLSHLLIHLNTLGEVSLMGRLVKLTQLDQGIQLASISQVNLGGQDGNLNWKK